MNKRFLSMCGVIAPVLFVFMTILGGAIRPGYSHISDTVSELLSPGAPNKLLLDTLHTIYALLLALFGIGVLRLVRGRKQSRPIGVAGASMFIVMGLVSVATAIIFPQDAWGSPPTFPGEMHKILSGVIALLTILSMLLIGIWFNRVKLFPGFGTYSFITVGVVVLSAGFFVANLGSPIMGLTERITILVGFQWTLILALWMFSRKGCAGAHTPVRPLI
jgi:hypothetical membrane protein